MVLAELALTMALAKSDGDVHYSLQSTNNYRNEIQLKELPEYTIDGKTYELGMPSDNNLPPSYQTEPTPSPTTKQKQDPMQTGDVIFLGAVFGAIGAAIIMTFYLTAADQLF